MQRHMAQLAIQEPPTHTRHYDDQHNEYVTHRIPFFNGFFSQS
jgi:hypothetical protein